MDTRKIHAAVSAVLYELDVNGWGGGSAPPDEYDDVAWSFIATLRDRGVPGVEARINDEFPLLDAPGRERLISAFSE